MPLPEEHEEASPDRQHDPERASAAEEERRTLDRLIAALPEEHREVLLLRFREELGLEEIATVTATPISTVKSRLYRGLTALKTALAEGAA